jgi:hypothetical protein
MQRKDAEKLVMVRTGEASGLALIGTSSGAVKQPETSPVSPASMIHLRSTMIDLLF